MVPVVLLTALPMKSTGATIFSPPPPSRRLTVTLRPLLRAVSWMRGRSDCGSDREIFTGWISLMVTSEEAPTLLDGVTRLPGWIRMGPVLPVTGARMRLYSRFRRAIATWALSASTVAASALALAAETSRCCTEMAFCRNRSA